MRTIVALTLASAALAANVFDREVYERAFFDHVKTYGLELKDGAEFAARLQVFADNYDLIDAHNKQGLSYKLGLNKFSHLTLSEFHDAVRLGGVRPPQLRKASSNVAQAPIDPKVQLPASVDWTTTGAVNPVKDQGSCGSCWAFSAVSTIESAHWLKYGSLYTLSEQQVVSCDKVDAGCNGGWMDDAYTFVKGNGGITTTASYPYTSGTSGATGTCKTTGYTNIATTAPKSFTDVTVNNVVALQTAVAQQPVAIAIQANQVAFQSYSSGVLTGRCGQRLDHGVVVVGYGTDPVGGDYWKVRNSWGTGWGEKGYIRIERSAADLCGVLDAPSYPNL